LQKAKLSIAQICYNSNLQNFGLLKSTLKIDVLKKKQLDWNHSSKVYIVNIKKTGAIPLLSW